MADDVDNQAGFPWEPSVPAEQAPVVEQATAVPMPNGQALTASPADLGGFAADLAQDTAAVRAQPIEAAVQADRAPWLEKTQAMFTEMGLSYIIEPLFGPDDGEWGFQADFNPASHWDEIRTEYALDESDATLEKFRDTESLGQMHYIATRMRQHLDAQQLLDHHGWYAFGSGMLDPAMLTVDIATFGASKAYKLGRLSSAALGATTLPAYSLATDLAGREVSGTEYLLNAALGGAGMALFGGAAGVRAELRSARRRDGGAVTHSSLNDFLTEADRLAVNEDAREVIAPVMDDPLRREGYLNNSNAASYFRLFANELDGLYRHYTDTLERVVRQNTGINWIGSKLDWDNRFLNARDELERQVARNLAERDLYYQRFGTSKPAVINSEVEELSNIYEQIMNRAGEMAKDAGLKGFEEFKPRSGYFHRSWNAAAISRFARDKNGKRFLRGLISESALRGIRGIDTEEANLIADAIITRAQARMTDSSVDFMGMLGKADTEHLRNMLENTPGVSQARVDSIMKRLEQDVEEAGTVKYAKSRLPLDMTITGQYNGQTVSMLDFIDTDIARLAENYTHSIAGRSALAKVGIGGDDESLDGFMRRYAETLQDLPENIREDRMLSLRGLLGDFTGMRPEQNILGQGAQRVKSWVDATLLSASGMWQTAEMATIAYKYGSVESIKQFVKRFPGIRNILNNMDDDLYEELRTVVGLDLARDVRVHAWVRQHEARLSSNDHLIDRVLHTGKQLVPFLNGMKYVHSLQTRMNANLALNKIVRAAHGDADAIRMVNEYGLRDTDTVFNAVRNNVTMNGQNAQQMNWAAWTREEREQALLVATRMMDDAVLYGRVGQGAGSPIIARSQVGQILGQMRSFVALAHNKLLRGTYHHEGIRGVAALVAYQYPLTALMVLANEYRKGNAVDLSNDKELAEVLGKAVGYTSGLGFMGDAFNVLGFGGSRGGMSIPITSVFNAAPAVGGGLLKVGQGEPMEGLSDIAVGAAMVTPTLMLIPGTQAAINAMKED